MKAKDLFLNRGLAILPLLALAVQWMPGEAVAQKGATSETDGSGPGKFATIDEAIARGDLANLQAFLKQSPSSLNKGARPELPPLMQAVMRRKNEIALFLIRAGADVNAVDGSGRTALHVGVERGSPDVIAALLKAKANPDLRDQTGWTPLHHAAARNKLECVKALLQGGANPKIRSDLGGTPLHEAAASGSAEIVQALLDAGVDPRVVSKTNQTALSIARGRGDEGVLKQISDALQKAETESQSKTPQQ